MVRCGEDFPRASSLRSRVVGGSGEVDDEVAE